MNKKLTGIFEKKITEICGIIIKTVEEAIEFGELGYAGNFIHIFLPEAVYAVMGSNIIWPRVIAIVVPELEEMLDCPVKIEGAAGHWARVVIEIIGDKKEETE